MNTLAGQRIQVGRQSRDKGLALTGFHLGNVPLVQGHAADHLRVKVAHTHHPLTRFTYQRKSFRENGIQAFPLGNTLFVFGSLGL